MSSTQTYPYTSGANYTFDSSKIEVTGGVAKLKLQDNTGQTFTEDFANDTGFTYDSGLTTISGTLSQDDQLPADGVLFATWDVDEDATWGDGTLTGTLSGTATISSGQLVCTTGAGEALSYSADNFGASSSQTGCIRTSFIPNYTGSPSATSQVFAIFKTASQNNQIFIEHQSGGTLRARVWDSTGSLIANQNFGTWSPTSGQAYELEYNYDYTGGAQRLFIDGTQFGQTFGSTGTRDATDLNTIRIGGDSSLTLFADGTFNNFLLFSAVQHTGNYTAPTAEPTSNRYLTDTVTLPSFSYSGTGSLQTFTAFSVTDTGSPRYILNGSYWNGSAWVASDDSYSQANSEADVNTNIGSLTASDSLVVKVVTPTGGTQATADDVSVTYTGQIYPTDTPTIEATTQFGSSALATFAETTTTPGSDAVQYVLVVDDQDRYWDGAAWADSNGTYAQSNPATTINTNAATAISSRSEMNVKAFLSSDDGSTTPELDLVSITHTSEQLDPTAPSSVTVQGYVYDANGPVASLAIKARPLTNGYWNSDVFQVYKYETIATTDSEGYFSGDCYIQGSGEFWEFKIGAQSYKTALVAGTTFALKDGTPFTLV